MSIDIREFINLIFNTSWKSWKVLHWNHQEFEMRLRWFIYIFYFWTEIQWSTDGHNFLQNFPLLTPYTRQQGWGVGAAKLRDGSNGSGGGVKVRLPPPLMQSGPYHPTHPPHKPTAWRGGGAGPYCVGGGEGRGVYSRPWWKGGRGEQGPVRGVTRQGVSLSL